MAGFTPGSAAQLVRALSSSTGAALADAAGELATWLLPEGWDRCSA
jgi:hypothetical protein